MDQLFCTLKTTDIMCSSRKEPISTPEIPPRGRGGGVGVTKAQYFKGKYDGGDSQNPLWGNGYFLELHSQYELYKIITISRANLF